MTFGFDWPNGFREDILVYYGNIHVYYPGMLHAKFQNHRPSGSKVEDFKGFCYL